MAKQTLGVGAAANDNTGDTLRTGGIKINDNFTEIYGSIGNGSDIQLSIANAAIGQVLRYNGSSFAPSDFSALTTSLDVSGNSIISSSNGNITVDPNGSGSVRIIAGGVTTTFSGSDGSTDIPGILKYKNKYTTLGSSPTAATYPGYFYTVDGDDNPYVNISITAGGIGATRAKVLTEYSSASLLKDVAYTTTPTNGQVLKWNSTTSVWEPGDDNSGISSLNVFSSFAANTGSTSANTQSDTLTILGGTNISTSITGDDLTINFTGTIPTTLAALTDTDFTGITQGDSLYWNGLDWIVTRSPIIWWELNSNGNNDYTFNGPGFAGPTNDPTIYVYRGFTYAFDNSINGGNHPIRIQSTQGLTGTPYTAGQNGSGSNVLYWTVPMDAPTTLYYQCTIHALMNGTINVVG